MNHTDTSDKLDRRKFLKGVLAFAILAVHRGHYDIDQAAREAAAKNTDHDA